MSQDPEGKPKKANIRDNHDGTYLVSYVPDMTGRYTILIKYGGDEIPYSPYRIRALPTGDASKCTVTGMKRTDGAQYMHSVSQWCEKSGSQILLMHIVFYLKGEMTIIT